MHVIDWTIVLIMLSFLVGLAVFTNKCVKNVFDFLAGERCAG
jgi:UPF0716 family protein affecting phage T7 exclusion